MKLCRFNDQRFGIVEGETIRDVSGALSVLPARHYPLPTFDTMVAAIDEVRAAAESVTAAPGLSAFFDAFMVDPNLG
jgi:2,4-didehydro-3-deoxy-L-rhamnonate hydrolase